MSAIYAADIQAADIADLPTIRALLAEVQLPTADLPDSSPVLFWLIREEEALLGTIALEPFADIALLRSLAVHPSRQGTGLGQALLQEAERQAAKAGIHTLCLLTTTADEFFAHLGYTRIARGELPEAVQRSEEFRSLCPASAICMIKQLSPG